jgi:hypothetical protein
MMQKTCLSFTAVNLPALRKKLGELNDSLAADPVSLCPQLSSVY